MQPISAKAKIQLLRRLLRRSPHQYLPEIDLSGRYLQAVDLRGANLYQANLAYCNLGRSVLSETDLSMADLQGARLIKTDLRNADLRSADLRGASLSGANLTSTRLSSVKYSSRTEWPSPTMMLLADWGTVSDKLCVELMRYDASCHPGGSRAFSHWKSTERCPYWRAKFCRAANFRERAELWSRGRPKTALKLVELLLEEKCIKCELPSS